MPFMFLPWLLVVVREISGEAQPSCSWHVAGQTFTPTRPGVWTADIGNICPRNGKGPLHDSVCEQCGKLHVPCAGSFMSCDGCCSSSVPTQHSCDQITQFFMESNVFNVTFVGAAEQGAIELQTAILDETSPQELVDEQESHHGCKVPFNNAGGDVNIPMWLHFDCTACAATGVGEELQTCCNAARHFLHSEHVAKLRSQRVEVFLDVAGCQQSQIGPGREYHFDHAEDYQDLSRTAVLEEMKIWIKDNWCPSVKQTCDSTNTIYSAPQCQDFHSKANEDFSSSAKIRARGSVLLLLVIMQAMYVV